MSKAVSSTSKKVKGTSSGDDDSDKLGELPESVLSNIMSLLPTKDVVRTSVLSTKWRYKWTMITNLYFEDSLLYTNKKRKSRKTMFVNFVERVLLLLGNSTIQEFNLSCSVEEYDPKQVAIWILAAMRHDARKIKIYCPLVKSLELPCLTYSCGTISELVLHVKCTIKTVPDISFTSLRIMDFEGVVFLNKSKATAGELTFRFDVLEVLNLVDCQWKSVTYITLIAPKLKSICMMDMKSTGSSICGTCDCKFILDVPMLASFKCHGFSVVHVSSMLCPSPIVDICLGVPHSLLSDIDKLMNARRGALQLLREFSNVKSLAIPSAILKVQLQVYVPILNNLIQLTLTDGKFDENLSALLRCSPGLESLIFSQYFSHSKNADFQKLIPQHTLLHLKRVEFQSVYMMGEKWIELAIFLLKNATSLEKMIITANSCSATEEIKLLLECPRCSPQASIVFSK